MKNSLLVLVFLFCCQLASAQLRASFPRKNLNDLKKNLTEIPQNLRFSKQIESFTHQELVKNNFSLLQNNQKQMPSVYAFKDLAFFCKIEVHLEKAVKMPVKFRLGSVDYVDYLEGKRDNY